MENEGTYNKKYYDTHKEQIMRNIKNYQAKMSAFTIKVKPSVYATYKAAAARAGMSFRAFVLEAIDEKMKKVP
jgi:predicted HicB family RNase H-like nuclease